MIKRFTFLTICTLFMFSCKQEPKVTLEDIKITPISHGTLVLEYDSIVFYVDPVGGAEAFKGQKPADMLLITDIHGDHLNVETLEGLNTTSAQIIAPEAVAERLTDSLKTKTTIMTNGDQITFDTYAVPITVEAIPMYNLREEAKQFHEKGRGNGYVITIGSKRVYISGDTEDIDEMRALEAIDIAFVCMNLPWTMPVESAADAVLAFKPKVVYPYHYRGTEGLSDVSQFKTLVNSKDPDIDVRLENWYPNR